MFAIACSNCAASKQRKPQNKAQLAKRAMRNRKPLKEMKLEMKHCMESALEGAVVFGEKQNQIAKRKLNLADKLSRACFALNCVNVGFDFLNNCFLLFLSLLLAFFFPFGVQ